MSRMVDGLPKRDFWQILIFLGTCICILLLHFLAENVHHFDLWVEFSQPVEQTHPESLQEFDLEDEFVLPGIPSASVGAFLSTSHLKVELFSAALSISPLSPPPKQ